MDGNFKSKIRVGFFRSFEDLNVLRTYVSIVVRIWIKHNEKFVIQNNTYDRFCPSFIDGIALVIFLSLPLLKNEQPTQALRNINREIDLICQDTFFNSSPTDPDDNNPNGYDISFSKTDIKTKKNIFLNIDEISNFTNKYFELFSELKVIINDVEIVNNGNGGKTICLVLPGIGKSTLISMWYDKLELETNNLLILDSIRNLSLRLNLNKQFNKFPIYYSKLLNNNQYIFELDMTISSELCLIKRYFLNKIGSSLENSFVKEKILITTARTTSNDNLIIKLVLTPSNQVCFLDELMPEVIINNIDNLAVRIQGFEEIQNIPTRSVTEVIALQPGVVVVDGDMHIRGGRQHDVGYHLEGANTRLMPEVIINNIDNLDNVKEPINANQFIDVTSILANKTFIEDCRLSTETLHSTEPANNKRNEVYDEVTF